VKELIEMLQQGPCHDVEVTARLMTDAAHALEEAFDPVRDIEAFHVKFGHGYTGKPRLLSADMDEFRRKFLNEELEEYMLAVDEAHEAMCDGRDPAPHIEKALDALVDLTYVAVGTAYLHGFDFREAWRRVQGANMKKILASSAADSTRGYAGDVIKPPGWVAPSHADLVADHAHKKEEP
jgi:predicted HAD superfamily Cof-like phosphohydrolase